MKKTKIGFVGCGDISGIYLKNITTVFKDLEIAGVCDLIPEKAQKASDTYGVKKIYNNAQELISDDEVDIVLNLTRPYEHFDVSMAAIKAGKHVYTEKPLGADLDEGMRLAEAAAENKVLIGGAPDTFLGAGIQTCRKLVDDGFIGDIAGASAFMVCRGHETWHPDPEFYYKRGGGPLFDMGPYYLTALVNLIGGIDSVSAMTKISYPKRVITSLPKNGTVIDVDVPTYVTGAMQFENGAIGTIFTTFDVYHAQVPRIEIYGSKGTLSVPDPNTFGGPVKLYRPESKEYMEMPLLFGYAENSRGLGLNDMANSIKNNSPFRTCSDLTLHVLEVMSALYTSGNERRHVDIVSKVQRPPALNGWN